MLLIKCNTDLILQANLIVGDCFRSKLVVAPTLKGATLQCLNHFFDSLNCSSSVGKPKNNAQVCLGRKIPKG